MDAEQESRWAAAQGIGIGEDLVPAALRHLEFLAAVDRRRWLYDGPLLHRAIRRYPSPSILLPLQQHKRPLRLGISLFSDEVFHSSSVGVVLGIKFLSVIVAMFRTFDKLLVNHLTNTCLSKIRQNH